MILSKKYDPKIVESKWQKRWEEEKIFIADVNTDKPLYIILLPPPNVTGILHLGHVLNMTIQDVFIRIYKMRGFEVLWLPGTDHAGIATQNVVERRLAQKGLSRFDLGREKFVEEVWKWKEEYHGRIVSQMKSLGLGCDWSRETFTLDESFSKAVEEAFIRLFEKGYIYRDEYIVNYCPRCETVISNEEVEDKEIEGKLYYINYPLKKGGKLTVATTRPETMLGDTGVAVNPLDERYEKFIGEVVVLPLVEREIPVISDLRVDKNFGTGVVKITPAHDPVDFEIGREHNLLPINILDRKGFINENGGKYKGMSRFEAREKIVEDLTSFGLLEKVENYTHSVGHCSRCKTIVEPYISKQWFVRMEEMAEKAKKAVEDGRVKFYLPRWEKVYNHWLSNIRPWVISRQLWWGHRIPVYYCGDCEEIMVCREAPSECSKCGSKKISQEEDVLDTWFSSWLWPFAPFGWPEKTKELEVFFPSTTLVTGWDIIFLWVARMIMASLEFMGEVPFKKVYFTGMIRDSKRRPLSKSLGNSPDPLDLIAVYGADALRIGILRITPEGKDVIYKEESIAQGRNFLNKVWNVARFLMANCKEGDKGEIENISLTKMDKWIISKVMGVIRELEEMIDSFKISEASRLISLRFWDDFCDWYLEMIKPRIYSKDETKRKNAISVALWAFEQYLKLMHPFIPHITEEIYGMLPYTSSLLINSEWPTYRENYRDLDLEREMDLLREFVFNIRNLRGELNLSPDLELEVVVDCKEDFFNLLKEEEEWILKLGGIKELKKGEKISNAAFFHLKGMDVFIPLVGLIDFERERERLKKEIESLEGLIKELEEQLLRKDFLTKAPPEVVKKTKEKQERLKEKHKKLIENLKRIS
ncbi:MAG: valine--tRNA ligase [candidate division WOR-3 bacterium]